MIHRIIAALRDATLKFPARLFRMPGASTSAFKFGDGPPTGTPDAMFYFNLTGTTASTMLYVNIAGTWTPQNIADFAANGITLAANKSLVVTTADLLTVGGVIVPQEIVVNSLIMPHASLVTRSLFAANGLGWTVTAARAWPCLVEGGARTAVISKAASGSAPAAATTPIHSGTIDCNATAYTQQALTLSSTGADLVLAATDTLGITFNAAMATAVLFTTIKLKRS